MRKKVKVPEWVKREQENIQELNRTHESFHKEIDTAFKHNTRQSRKGSVLESIVNIAVGIGLSFVVNWFLHQANGIQMSVAQNVQMTAVFTAMSFIRSYFLRRLFNKFKF